MTAYIWTGATSNVYGTSGNWAGPGTPPPDTSSESAVFSTGGANTNVSVAFPISADNWIFSGSTGYAITGASVSLSSGILNTASVAQSIANVISGSGSLIQNGDGTLTLTGNNSYSGGTFVQSGTLQLGATGKLGTFGKTDVSGGVLDLSGTEQSQSRVTQTGGTIQNGKISSTISVMTQSGGTFSAEASAGDYDHTGGTMSGTVTVTGGGTYNQTGGTVSGDVTASLYNLVGGTLSGNATVSVFNQTGGIMSGTADASLFFNLYDHSGGLLSGTATVETYRLTNSAATSTGGTIEATSGFVLGPTSGEAVVAAKLSGAGDLEKNGFGQVRLTNAANDYTGDTTIREGILTAAVTGALGDIAGSVSIIGGFLSLNATTHTKNGGVLVTQEGRILNGTLSTSDAFDFRSGLASAVLAGSGKLTKTEATTFTLTGANTYTGDTFVTGGTLLLSGAGKLGDNTNSTSVNGATAVLDLGGTSQTQTGGVSLAGGGKIMNGSLAGGITTTGGLIDGVGGTTGLVVSSGVTTMTNSNIFSGATTINNGLLLVNGSNSNSVTTVKSTGTLGGSGITGAVNVESNGTLSPGDSIGAFTTTNVSLAAGAHFRIELLDLADYDTLRVQGTVALGGSTLDLSLIGGFTPPANTTFVIIDNDGTDAVTGTFAGLAEGASFTAGGSRFQITYHGGTGNDVVLSLADNGAPVNTVPGAQSTEANQTLAITGLAVSDPDSGAASITTALSVAHGTLAVASAGGAAVAGSGTGTVTLTGTAAQISTTLAAANNVKYTPANDFFGSDTLTIATNDGGNSGSGGAKTDTDQLAIKVGTIVPASGGNDDVTAPTGSARIDAGAGKDTISFNFKLTDATVTHVGNTVVIDGPSSHTVVTGFEVFRFTDGAVDNADGNPLVDDLFYYAKYHDVWNAHADADAHFNTFGWKEGRDPNAFFDTNGYLATYTDVKAANVNPLDHYHTYGWKEGRDPSKAFDTTDYLANYQDIANAQIDPLAHFLLFGAAEQRTPFNDNAWG